MELCRQWKLNKRHNPLGGCICIGGGVKTKSLPGCNDDTAKPTSQENQTQFTDVLIITGSNDTVFTPKEALKTKSSLDYYDASKVQIHVQEGKGHGMIESREEMQVVMEFLSKRLVRRMTSMEGMSKR